MAAPDLTYANLFLSWICQELCIEHVITLKEDDVTSKGYAETHYAHFSEEDVKNFAKDFEELLDESFLDAEVKISKDKRGEWFDLHITFKLVP